MTEPGARQGIAGAARLATALGTAAAIVVLGLVAVASGATGSWSTGGPANADVTDVVVDPDTPQTVYAASDDGGVHKSIDGGESWAPANTGLTETFVADLAIDPDTPQTLYAATVGGVFKSTDGAASWAEIGIGLTTAFIGALAIDPDTPTTLYAGGRNSGGVFKSIDGGANWAPSSNGLTPSAIATLAIDPDTPTTLYAGGRIGDGVFKSTDGGANWSAASSGLTDLRVRELAIDPDTPQTLYAATLDGVFKSTDGGANWSAANGGFGAEPNVEAIALDPAHPETLYVGGVEGGDPAGVYRSVDGGANWSPFNTGLSIGSRDVTALTTTPSGGTIYAGTANRGVYQHTLEGGDDDEDPPDTFITAGPEQGLPTTDTTPSFSFSADEPGSTFVCEVDGGAAFPCTSPHQLGPLLDGPHSFAVHAVDAAGNHDETPAERTFFVDSEPSEIGVLTQKAGSAGCLAAESHQGCATAATAREAFSVAVSPDGQNVYAAGGSFEYIDIPPEEGGGFDIVGTAELTAFDRDGDGALTAAASHGLDSGSPDETAASGFDVAVSPDGTNVYATSVSGVAVFDRAPDGSLTGAGGTSLANAGQIELSPDGTSAYVTTVNAVAIFDRAPSGTLVADGSVSLPDSLSGGEGIFYPDVAVSPDDENVYVAYTADYEAGPSQAVIATFDRASGGALAETGCVSEDGENGCADGFGLYGAARGLTVSPDGENLYAATSERYEHQVNRGQIAVFDRTGAGSLSQKGSGAGCISGRSQGVPPAPGCAEGGGGLQSLSSVAVSPEGSSVYAVSWRANTGGGGGGIQDGTIAALDRGLDGTLSPKPGSICCALEDAVGEFGDGRGIVGVERPAVSPDGLNVYSAAIGTKAAYSSAVPGAVGVFDRVPGTVSETDPPETTITLGPAEGATIGTDSPLFGFLSDEPGSTFSCSLDGGGFFPCTSPHQLGPLADGEYTFEVFATDLAGNPDPDPAERTFTVDAVPVELLVNDEGDGGEDDGGAAREACEEGAAGCTLPGALAAANADEERNRISFAAGVEEIDVVEDQLVIENDAAVDVDVEIAGSGTRALTISEGGGAAHRALLEVEPGAGAVVSGLSFSGFSYLDSAQTEGEGSSAETESTAAAVVNEGELSLARVAITDSTVKATAGAGQDATAVAVGGGILNSGELTVSASTVSGGEVVAAAVAGKGDSTPGAAAATAVGGGIVNDGGDLRLERSTVSGNFNAATAAEGSPNSAASRGGGIANEGGAVELAESTVAFNTAGLASNLFTGSGATTEFRSTLLAQPSGGENCDGGGDVVSAGFNLEDADGCELDAGSDQTGADPALAPLADNGGPTDTHAIAPGSPALDRGDSSGATTDQRSAGFARPVDFPALVGPGDGADVGAYELQPGAEGPVGDPSCGDGFDNDADGFADAADPNCQSASPPSPSPPAPPAPSPPPPSLTPPPATAPDTGIPRLRAAAPRSQKQRGKRIALRLSLGAPEAILVKVTGTIKVKGKKYRLRALRRKIGAGKRATVRIKPASKRVANRVAAAIRRWRGAKGKAKRRLAVKAVLKIVVTDGAGNRKVKRKLITLK